MSACPYCKDRLRDPCGLHQLLCREDGKGNARGGQGRRHFITKNSLITTMVALAKQKGKPTLVDPTEPKASVYWNYKAGVPAEAEAKASRADILLQHLIGKNDKNAVLIDLAIPTPIAATVLSKASTTPGHAAAQYAQVKFSAYGNKFIIPTKDAFVPFIQEAGGRLHPIARTFLGDFMRTLLDKSPEDPFSAWTPEDKEFYLSGLRCLMETASTATAKGVAISLLHKGGVMPVQASPAGDADE